MKIIGALTALVENQRWSEVTSVDVQRWGIARIDKLEIRNF